MKIGSRMMLAPAALTAATAGALVLACPRKTPSLTMISSTAGAASARTYSDVQVLGFRLRIIFLHALGVGRTLYVQRPHEQPLQGDCCCFRYRQLAYDGATTTVIFGCTNSILQASLKTFDVNINTGGGETSTAKTGQRRRALSSQGGNNRNNTPSGSPKPP